MSNNNNNNESSYTTTEVPPSDRPRRASITTQSFSNLFSRSNSIAGNPTSPFPGPITTAAAQDQRRRMSISTLGLSGTSPSQPNSFAFAARRASVSTAGSDSIDENAVDDDDGPAGRSQPTTPFGRRMSFGAQALRTVRGGSGGSPGSSGEGGGFNWSEQLRSRAESSVSGQRPSFSSSPSTIKSGSMPHDRTKSVSELPSPPSSISAPAPPREIKKPDAFQERILKGDFYMD